MKKNLLKGLTVGLIVVAAFIFHGAQAQVDTLQAAKPDTVIQEKGKKEKKEDDKKRKDEFIPYVGLNFNTLGVSENEFEANTGIGWHLGFDYKRGKFFYWQVGLRYNNAVYKLEKMSESKWEDNIAIRSIDVPITGGINFLSAINRIVALRLFISAVPAFNIAIGENDFGFNKDDINSFIAYGQAGIGVNVAFLVIEAGYNFGFQDMLKNYESQPGQLFVNLGFRF